jgi:hypothetical protein
VSYLYAHRVDASGTKLWSPASGVPIRHMSGHPYYPVIVSDEEEGAIISWADNRNIGGDNGYDVYAQRIDDTGMCLWRENGDSLCTAPGSQASLTAIVDGAGGMIVAWEDGREADTDIYAQLINGDGTFTACLLQSFAAAYGGAGIRIAWTIEEIPGSVEFFVLRRSIPDGRYEEVSNPAIDRDGCSFRFIDDGCESGRTYSYRIDVVDEAGRRTLFETDPITAPAAALRLFQNSPNPFNPSTVIGYHLPERCRVTLEIFDIAGRRIARLVDGVQGGGRHEVTWNGTGENGDRVDSGTYLYRLTAGKETISRKMILLR